MCDGTTPLYAELPQAIRAAIRAPVRGAKSRSTRKSTLKRVVVGFVDAGFLIMMLVVTGCDGKDTSSRGEDVPILVVSPEELDFGSVFARDQFPWKLHIRNPGSQTVEVIDLRPSCGCTKVTPTSLTISPGETREVQLTLDLTKVRAERAEPQAPNFGVQITPVIEDRAAAPVVWTLKGRVHSFLDISPPTVRFDDELTEGCAFPEKKVLISSSIPLDSLEAECDFKFATLECAKENSPWNMSFRSAPARR